MGNHHTLQLNDNKIKEDIHQWGKITREDIRKEEKRKHDLLPAHEAGPRFKGLSKRNQVIIAISVIFIAWIMNLLFLAGIYFVSLQEQFFTIGAIFLIAGPIGFAALLKMYDDVKYDSAPLTSKERLDLKCKVKEQQVSTAYRELLQKRTRINIYKKILSGDELEQKDIASLLSITLAMVEADFADNMLYDSFKDGTINDQGRERLDKYTKLFKYQEEGVASVYDLAEMTSRHVRLIKKEFEFFNEKQWMLNLVVLPDSGIFVIDGEPLYKSEEVTSDPMSKFTKVTTMEEKHEKSRCRGCGSLIDPNLKECEYCGRVY